MALLNDTPVHIQLFPQQMTALLRGPNGPVYRKMIILAEAVRAESKRLVGVHHPQPAERRVRAPGTLQRSIVKRPVEDTKGDIGWAVGSADPIALIHHEGTQPHIIRPTRGKYLVFYWPRAGKVVYMTEVKHPGTKPNRYLTNALKILPRVLNT